MGNDSPSHARGRTLDTFGMATTEFSSQSALLSQRPVWAPSALLGSGQQRGSGGGTGRDHNEGGPRWDGEEGGGLRRKGRPEVQPRKRFIPRILSCLSNGCRWSQGGAGCPKGLSPRRPRQHREAGVQQPRHPAADIDHSEEAPDDMNYWPLYIACKSQEGTGRHWQPTLGSP